MWVTEIFSLPWSDACRLAPGRDALINWRTLPERSELVRVPKAGVSLMPCGGTGRHCCMMRLEERNRYWVLLPPQQRKRPSGRAKQQARLPGRNPAYDIRGQTRLKFKVISFYFTSINSNQPI